MHKAVFLDRDGTLNKDHGCVHKVEDFELLPGVIEGLKLLSAEFIFFIVTNQSGIGRGMYTIEDVEKFNGKLVNELKKKYIHIKKIYICAHLTKDNCNCRKPNAKFINEAEKEFNINLKNSWVVGDKPADIKMGTKSGCRSVYVFNGHGKKCLKDLERDNLNPDFIAKGFYEASNFIANKIDKKCQK